MENFLENFYAIFVDGALLDDLITEGMILPSVFGVAVL
jgi:hypothetical protein